MVLVAPNFLTELGPSSRRVAGFGCANSCPMDRDNETLLGSTGLPLQKKRVGDPSLDPFPQSSAKRLCLEGPVVHRRDFAPSEGTLAQEGSLPACQVAEPGGSGQSSPSRPLEHSQGGGSLVEDVSMSAREEGAELSDRMSLGSGSTSSTGLSHLFNPEDGSRPADVDGSMHAGPHSSSEVVQGDCARWPRDESVASAAAGEPSRLAMEESPSGSGSLGVSQFTPGASPSFVPRRIEGCPHRLPPLVDTSALHSVPRNGSEDELEGGAHRTPEAPTPAEQVVITERSVGEVPLVFGSVALCGRRREMEDSVATVPGLLGLQHGQASQSEPLHFFAVYDGHGGVEVSSYCARRLHWYFRDALIGPSASPPGPSLGDSMARALAAACLQVDAEVCGKIEPSIACADCEQEKAEAMSSDAVGSTAIIVALTSAFILVGNCGDSRAVLCRAGQALPLSVDHKPDRPDEKSRIESMGGHVVFWQGAPRVMGMLAMSRAIGDRFLKPFVTAEPEIQFIQRSPLDEFLVLASDGLWDVLSNDVVCEVVQKCMAVAGRRHRTAGTAFHGAPSSSQVASDTPPARAAAILSKLAISRGSSDNISIIVVALQ